MNLQLTNQVDYAIRAMAFLAESEKGKWIPSSMIAEEMEISRMFLSRINMYLGRAGLIRSQRGAKGGVMLAKDPAEISIHDIIVAVDGPILVNKCLETPDKCTFPLSTQLGTFWQSVQDDLVDRLKSASLKDLTG
jgi:Rrf2 family protein